MRPLAFLSSVLLVGTATSSLAAGISGTWDCRLGASTIATLSISGTGYQLDTPGGEHGSGSFAFALPDESSFTLDGYLADKFEIVGGILTHTMMNNPELQFVTSSGGEVLCTGSD